MNNIIEKLRQSNNIVLLCHINPDGDAIGSTIGLYVALKKMGKNVDMIIKNIPQKFSFLPYFSEIKAESDKKYDLAVVLDTAVKERVNCEFVLEKIKEIVVIDHHSNNTKYGTVNYVCESPACAEIIYNLIKEMGVIIDSDIATAICAGLLTDTGGFAYSSVTADTFIVASELRKIIDISSIYKRVLQTITKSQLELKKIYFDNLKFYENESIAISYVTEDDIKSVHATLDECDILVNIAREIENVKVSIFIREGKESNRVSIRTVSDINANRIAKRLGGGGHINAAGALSDMSMDAIIEILVEEARNELNEWYSCHK